jgi:hypothetical protein
VDRQPEGRDTPAWHGSGATARAAPRWRRWAAGLGRAGALLAFALAVGVVQAGELRAPDGRLRATLGPDGDLRDPAGRLLLRFEPDGDVRDPAGRKAASMAPDGDVRQASGTLLARVRPDGSIRDPAGRLLGRLEPDGDARDPAGRLIGSAREVRRAWAAYFFFVF